MAKSIATIENNNLTLAALSKNFKIEILASACRLYILVTLVDVGDKANIHRRPVTNFQGRVKLLGGAELCENAVYILNLKYFLIKSQFPGGICLLCSPADARASIGN